MQTINVLLDAYFYVLQSIEVYNLVSNVEQQYELFIHSWKAQTKSPKLIASIENLGI